MAFANANQVALRISKETLWGETPATPAMTEIRFTGESLNHQVETVESNVIRSDRMRDDNLLVGVGAEGDINIELAYGDFDTLLESAFMSAFVTVATAANQTIAVDSAAKTFTRSAGSFITDGFKVGLWIHATTASYANAGNQKYFRATTVTATVITVEDPFAELVTEAGTANEQLNAKYLRNGTADYSLLIEKAFVDISKFIYFNGCRCGQMQLQITAKEIVTAAFSYVAKQGVSGGATISGSVTPAGAKTALTASANIGSITKDGVSLSAAFRTLSLNLSNNLRQQAKVGQKALAGVGTGFSEVTGSIEFFMEDLVIYQLMENHTPFALSMRFTDPAANVFIVTLPKLYLNKSNANAQAGNTDVYITADLAAVRDPNTSCVIQIDKF